MSRWNSGLIVIAESSEPTLVVTCKHCQQAIEDHADGHCLFASTVFEPFTMEDLKLLFDQDAETAIDDPLDYHG